MLLVSLGSSAAAVTLSDTEEAHIGQILAEKYQKEVGLQATPQTQRIDAYLQRVGDRVSANAKRKLPYKFHFDPDPLFRSAFAFPGGQIMVGSGILAYIDTDDQLAVVLAHEVEHADLGQCRERLQKVLDEQHLAAKDADRLKIDPFLPGYGHDNELAADREGVKLAIKAGYSALGAIRLLETYDVLGQKMQNQPREAKQMIDERIAQIRELSKDAKEVKETPFALP